MVGGFFFGGAEHYCRRGILPVLVTELTSTGRDAEQYWLLRVTSTGSIIDQYCFKKRHSEDRLGIEEKPTLLLVPLRPIIDKLDTTLGRKESYNPRASLHRRWNER